MIGTRLAHYEITGHLGSGGMGVVYQATDSKLGRSVAIKILPEVFARDAERIARFEREARMLASLNHPHIAAIYGLEESSGRNFLVMELVQGETLAVRIARGPIPISEALPIARQVAAALEAAHERGVIHRDLKPANIIVTVDGEVKVLDFGLAKAFVSEAAKADSSNLPTLSLMTDVGIVLGTAAYMSPEQAKGLEVDRRSDIFAFGSVLFEMLTGRPAFRGDTVAETVARVIEREPDWKSVPSTLPTSVQELLRRCLEKDPKKRRRDSGDIRLEIEHAIAEPGSGGVPVRETSPRRASLFAWIAVLLAIALAVTLAAPHLRTPTVAPEMRLEITTPSTIDPASFAISPNGSYLVFVASSDGQPRLWLRPLDTVTARLLPGTEGASFPFWDPNSRSVAFFAANALKRIDIAGGLPQKVTDITLGMGGMWGADDTIVFAPNPNSSLFRIPAIGGTAVALTKLGPDEFRHRFPQFLPGGRKFLFYVFGNRAEVQGIYLGSLDSKETKRLTAADSAGSYVTPGWLLFVFQGRLVARRFDPSSGELSGAPLMVADSVIFGGSQGSVALSVSASGLVAYRTGVANRRQLTWYDRTGHSLGTLGDADTESLVAPEISPDGRQILVSRTIQGNSDLWVLDSTGRRTRLTLDGGYDGLGVWSPIGNEIAFASSRNGTFDLFKKPANGTAGAEQLLERSEMEIPDDWSADGNFLLFFVKPTDAAPDVWVLPFGKDGKPGTPTPIANTPADERMSEFSPDTHWVAYQSDESGQFEIYVKPFPLRPGQWPVSKGGGSQVRWSSDRNELYYISLDGKLMVVPFTVNGTNFDAGPPVALFPMRIWGGGANQTNRQQYDVDAKGRFLMDVIVEDAPPPITVLLNWKPPSK